MAKSRRGGASAPQHCKTSLKSCIKEGPALSPSTAKACFTEFNRCRKKRTAKKRTAEKAKKRTAEKGRGKR
jgi:hypothetical protein